MSKTFRAILPFLVSGFLFSIILSSTAYFNSTFIESSFPNIKAGIWYTASAVLVLFGSFFLPTIQSKIGNRKTTLIILILLSLSLLGLSFPKSNLSSIFFIAFLVSGTITFSVLDIFIEKYSDDRFTGQIRGIYLTSLNLAWIFSPLIGSKFIGEENNFQFLYAIAFLLSIIVILSISFSSRKFQDEKYVHHKIKDFWKSLKDKNITKSLLVQFSLQFFYAWMVIYTPIYLRENLLLSWETIGKIFLVMLIPFVLIQYPLGKLADKKHDEKDLLTFGFLIASISTIIFGFYNGSNIAILAILLFMTRIGAAIIEVMSESYFFKTIGSNEPTKVSLFRMMYPTAYLVAPLVATVVLLGNNFNLLYLILSFFLVGVTFLIKNLKDLK